jgi:F-type H+-transporting ATPase subunit gamma
MTDSIAALRHKINSATDLQSVVRTMRALAASSIHQYEQSVLALTAYRHTVEQGLGACLRASPTSHDANEIHSLATASAVGAIVFGSDQGLVGQFNEVITDYAIGALHALPSQRKIWAVGERTRVHLEDAGLAIAAFHPVPNTVDGIAPLVERLLLDVETHASQSASTRIEIFHNHPLTGALYKPVQLHLLPLDAAWRASLIRNSWPTTQPPQVLGSNAITLQALIREHLFIALFQACAESLASENASRLAAMQRADQNIEDLLMSLHGKFHSQRQDAIDEELFDVTAGYTAVANVSPKTKLSYGHF